MQIRPVPAASEGEEQSIRMAMAQQSNRILVVDDEQMVRKTLKMLLTRIGYNVVSCENGHEALSKIAAEEFSLVLVDLGLPGMNGEALAMEIKKLRPGLPLVLMSGTRPMSLGSQFVGVLLKPFSLKELREVLNRFPPLSG